MRRAPSRPPTAHPARRPLAILALALTAALTLAAPATGQTTLYNFAGGQDGAAPLGALAPDAAGALLGTTSRGGTASRGGTIFRLALPAHAGKPWREKILFRFPGGTASDARPNAYLVAAPGGTGAVQPGL